MIKLILFSILIFFQAGASILELKNEENQLVSIQTPTKKVLVIFWASWCPSCKEKLTQILPKWNENKNITILAVNTDEDLERAKHFSKSKGIIFPLYFDENKKLQRELNVKSIPYWAIFNRDLENQYNLVARGEGFDQEKIKTILLVP